MELMFVLMFAYEKRLPCQVTLGNVLTCTGNLPEGVYGSGRLLFRICLSRGPSPWIGFLEIYIRKFCLKVCLLCCSGHFKSL